MGIKNISLFIFSFLLFIIFLNSYMEHGQVNSQVCNNKNNKKWVGAIIGRKCMTTGLLVSPKLVLTTAYCVYSLQSQKHNLELGDIFFLPGVHGKIQKAYKVVDYRFPQEYKQSNQKTKRYYEFALLKLQREVQNSSIITLGTDYTFSNDDNLRMFGYCVGEYLNLDLWQYYQILSQNAKTNEIVATNTNAIIYQFYLEENQTWNKVDNALFQHTFQTKMGSGGSPIVFELNNQLIVVGIHIVSKANSAIRCGRLITSDLASLLVKWAEQMNSPPPRYKALNQEYYKNKIKQIQSVNQQLLASNLHFRQENACIKRKHQNLCQVFEKFRDIQKLSLQDLMSKIKEINELYFKHSINDLGSTILYQPQQKKDQELKSQFLLDSMLSFKEQ